MTTNTRVRYWLAIAYCDIKGEKQRDAEAFVLAEAPENGRGWGIAGPNSRDLDFMYDTADDRAAARRRFEEHGFAIVHEREFPVGGSVLLPTSVVDALAGTER